MHRLLIKTPRVKPSMPISSTADQYLLNLNTFDDVEMAQKANETVKNVFNLSANRQQNAYKKYPDDHTIAIGQYAHKFGVESAIRQYRSKHLQLKQQTVSEWKAKYAHSLKMCTKATSQLGRHLQLGNEVDEKVRQHILRLRHEREPISNAIVISVARVYLKRMDLIRYRLKREDLITKDVGRYLLSRMNLVLRKSTKTAKKIISDFEKLKI